MNIDKITVQDCIDMMQFKGRRSIINDGEVIGFEYEKSTADNQSDQC